LSARRDARDSSTAIVGLKLPVLIVHRKMQPSLAHDRRINRTRRPNPAIIVEGIVNAVRCKKPSLDPIALVLTQHRNGCAQAPRVEEGIIHLAAFKESDVI
jgi:hypothetical protein